MGKSGSLEKKVGQLLVVGVPGTSLDRSKLDLLGRLGIGGVVHFAANYESVEQLVELNNSIQKTLTAEAYQNFPAWICADHEGGRVQRFKAPFTEWPPQALWGELNSPKTCFEAGYVIAKELLAVGVNCNFAPVIDVLQTQAKAIGDRAYSSNPEVVANLGSATLRGLMKGGVFAVAKHFPGHGGVEVDSHVDLPVCHKSAEELDALDWVPFKKAFRSRLEGVMTAHILFPKIDGDRPSTLSRKILQEHLRKSLRFSKLIFSDDLEMGAIQKKYSLKDAAFLAFEAGCDQLLLCHEWNQIEEVHSYLVNAFETGALNTKKLDESIERIADAKKRFLLPFKFTDVELAKAIVGAPDFKAVAQAIREKRPIESGPSMEDGSDAK
jgi:beta-N-acetylhexosaminidase